MMTVNQAAARIVSAIKGTRGTNLEPMDVAGGLQTDIDTLSSEIPSEEQCDALAGANIPPELAALYPATVELIQTN